MEVPSPNRAIRSVLIRVYPCPSVVSSLSTAEFTFNGSTRPRHRVRRQREQFAGLFRSGLMEARAKILQRVGFVSAFQRSEANPDQEDNQGGPGHDGGDAPVQP